MNRKADDESGNRFEIQLAEYASALESGRTETENKLAFGEIDHDPASRLARAQGCLRLIDRVRRTSPDLSDAPKPETCDAQQNAATGDSPNHIGRFEVVRLLGCGGAGAVFLAVDPVLGREVALKVPHPEVLATDELKQRFLREGKTAASLNHANIVPVLEAGSVGAIGYIASVYCEGPSLADWMAAHDGPVPELVAARLIVKLAQAIQHAHGRGVLHRDLKPSNVLLETAPNNAAEDGLPGESDTEPKITDFGLAKLLDVDVDATRSGSIIGTPAYMSPEQAGGCQSVASATDIYSLGVLLYELLTGRRPFDRGSTLATLRAVEEDQPVSPRRLRRGLSRDLEAICLKCLEKKPSHRYRSASELSDDLQRFRNGQSVHARPIGSQQRLWRWCRRKPLVPVMIGACTLVIVAFIAVGSWSLARMTLLNDTAHDAQTERDEARRAVDAERAAAEAQRFYLLLNNLKEIRSSRQPGWTWRAKEELDKAALLPTARENLAELRSEAIHCLASFDLRPIKTFASGFEHECLAFSPDGRHLALGQRHSSTEVNVRILDASTGQSIYELNFHPEVSYLLRSSELDGICSLAYGPDGLLLAAGTRSGWIYTWDLAQSPPQRLGWLAHRDYVTGLACHPHQAIVYSASRDGTVKRWRVAAEGALLEATFELSDISFLSAEERPLSDNADPDAPAGGTPSVDDVTICNDADLVVCAGAGRIEALDASNLKRRGQEKTVGWQSIHQTSVCLNHDGSLVISGSRDGEVFMQDTFSSRLVRQFIDESIGVAHEGEVCHVELHPTNALLVTASTQRRFKVWEVASGRLLASVFVGGSGGRIQASFRPDGRHLAVTASDCTRLYELSGLAIETFVAQHRAPIRAIALSPDQRRLACFAEGKNGEPSLLSVWDIDANRQVASLPVEGKVHGRVRLSHHPLSNLVAFTSPGSQRVTLWDYETGHSQSVFISLPRDVAFDRSGRFLWLAHGQGSKTPDGRYADRIESHEFSRLGQAETRLEPGESCAAWDNLGSQVTLGYSDIIQLAVGTRFVAAASRDRSAILLTTGTAEFVRRVSGKGRVESVALNANETLMAMGIDEGRLCVVEIATGKPLIDVAAHGDKILTIEFSADGGLLVTGSWDRTAKLWRVAPKSVEHLATIRLPAAPIRRITLSPDAKKLFVLVQNDTAVRVWHLDRLDGPFRQMQLRW